ncbi:hypothetical protein [Clostridium sp. C8]|uniref:hypothetical protein n=1 Tax=Clostridium sp. C8 TaxID=1667357 RepID=UPI00062E65EE|nr:hypothetical protein [Clostridium sp. C8]KLE15725.1 hypothetical protein AAT22_09975 [Clostridium sp. C8]
MADKLTVRFKPFKDESLISYFIRLSEKNGISLLPLLNSIKEIDSDYIQFSEIDIIDKIPFKHLNYNALEVLVGFNIDFLLKNTFYKLMERFSDTGEVEEIKICNKHKIKLLDSCPHCNHKIDYDKIISLGICSNCRKELSVNIEKEILDSNYFLYQTYLYEGWSKLIYGEYNKMNSQEIAYKILYILNEKRDFFNRERVKTSSNGEFLLPTLLQYARGTTKTKRTLHISTIIKILFENKITIEDFLNLQVPRKFIVSIKEKKQIKLAKTCCVAPWCKNYKINGALTKTSTNYKNLVDNSTLLYYMYCPECGCEYAYDESENLIERTSFIDGFNRLSSTWDYNISLENLAYKSCISEEKLKRLLAYFNIRGMFLKNKKTIVLKDDLINIFIKEIEEGKSLKEIMSLKCWKGYREYLLYRFHKDVMSAIITKKVVRNTEVTIGEKSKRVLEVLEELLKNDIPITLKKVCTILNVSPETIRYWKCNKLIADYKVKQKNNVIQKNREIIKEKIELFIEENNTCYIKTENLYKYIGVQRNILWRRYPEITAYITNKVSQHNKLI